MIMIIKMHVGVRQVGYPFDVLLKLSNRTGWACLILGQQQTNALAPADQKRGWLVMLSPLHVALSNIQVLPLLAILDKLQLLPTSWGLSMQWLF